MKIIDKFINFFRHKSPSFQEMIDFSMPRYKVKQKGNIFDSPFVARIVRPVWSFGLRHWQWILGFIATIIGLFIAYLKL